MTAIRCHERECRACPAEAVSRALEASGFRQGERFELCAIAPDKTLASRTWVLGARAVDSAVAWATERAARGANVYLGGNPLRRPPTSGRRPKDEDVGEVRVLLIDCDPTKLPDDPEGTSAAARGDAAWLADRVREVLERVLMVRPADVDSGRGRQVWLRHEPVEPELRARLLHGIARAFTAPRADIDTKTANASRLMRLPGFANLRTGDVAALLDPGDGRVASAERLLLLADALDHDCPVPAPAPRPKPTPLPARPPGAQLTERERLEDALRAIPADDRDDWLSVGMALHAELGWDGRPTWDRWSASSEKYDEHGQAQAWRSFEAQGNAKGRRGLGTIYWLAAQNGWRDPWSAARRAPRAPGAPPEREEARLRTDLPARARPRRVMGTLEGVDDPPDDATDAEIQARARAANHLRVLVDCGRVGHQARMTALGPDGLAPLVCHSRDCPCCERRLLENHWQDFREVAAKLGRLVAVRLEVDEPLELTRQARRLQRKLRALAIATLDLAPIVSSGRAAGVLVFQDLEPGSGRAVEALEWLRSERAAARAPGIISAREVGADELTRELATLQCGWSRRAAACWSDPGRWLAHCTRWRGLHRRRSYVAPGDGRGLPSIERKSVPPEPQDETLSVLPTTGYAWCSPSGRILAERPWPWTLADARAAARRRWPHLTQIERQAEIARE